MNCLKMRQNGSIGRSYDSNNMTQLYQLIYIWNYYKCLIASILYNNKFGYHKRWHEGC